MSPSPTKSSEAMEGDALGGAVTADICSQETPYCIECSYNLTGLKSERCPECGWEIDWDRARGDRERRRLGTPAHRADGLGVIGATVHTVILAHFVPWRFARLLRWDEKIWPSLIVALLSVVAFVVGLRITEGGWVTADDIWPFMAGVGFVIVAQSLLFATVFYDPVCASLRWGCRLRLWLIVSLYTTTFVGTWPVVGEPPIVLPGHTNIWLLAQSGGGNMSLGASFIFYWWWAILTVVLVVRNKPRWLALLAMPLVLLLTWLAAELVQFLVLHVA